MPIIKRVFFSVFGTVVLGFLFLSLLSYNTLDPAWSHVGERQEISNVGGRLGAWLADILYVFFGHGTWWLVLVMVYELVLLWWRQSQVMWQLRVLAYGFLLVCLSGLFAGWRMAGEHRTAPLAGGVMGFELYQGLSHLLGTVTTVLFLIAITVIVMLLVFEVHPAAMFGRLLSWLGNEKSTIQKELDASPKPEATLFDIMDEDKTTLTASPTSLHPRENLSEFLQTSGIRDEVMAQHTKQQDRAQHQFGAQKTNQVEIHANEVVLKVGHLNIDDSNINMPQEKLSQTLTHDDGQQSSLARAHQESLASENIPQQSVKSTHGNLPDDEQGLSHPIHAPTLKPSPELMSHEAFIDALNKNSDDPAESIFDIRAGTTHVPEHEHWQSDRIEGGADDAYFKRADKIVLAEQNKMKSEVASDESFGLVLEDEVDFMYQNHRTNQNANIRQDEIFSDVWTKLGDDLSSLDTEASDNDLKAPKVSVTEDDYENIHDHKNHINVLDGQKTDDKDSNDDDGQIKTAHHHMAGQDERQNEYVLSSEASLVNPPKSRAMDTLSYRMSLTPIPELSILDKPALDKKPSYTEQELAQLSELLEIKLKEFNIKAAVVSAMVGPVVTRFEVELAAGIKASRVTGAAQDLARSLSMASLRVVEVIPGKPYIGIEVPNKKREMVRLIELLDTPDYKNPNKQIGVAIGKDIGGKVVIADLAKAPHMLVAGTTGSGKSVFVNSILLSILLKYSPDELKLVLIDPKQLELANYGDIPHLLTPVITDMTEATAALTWCVSEMERRYQLMSLLRVRKISEFNKKVMQAEQAGEPIFDPLWRADENVSLKTAPKLKPLPLIVIVADEFADMIMQLGKTAEEPIVRLAQKARAAGIHLVLATQRPTVNVVTGLIKANIPSRVALRVNSKVDSRTIIEEGGAESMLGNGDMMFIGPGENTPQRVHGAYVDDDEVNRVCDAWRERGSPDYIDLSNSYTFEGEGTGEGLGKGGDDEYYHQAVTFVMESRKVSISSIQRKLGIGYNRAARIVDMMEEAGLVSPMDNSGKRQILM